MPLNSDEMMRVAATLADNNNLRVTVQESVKGGLLTGASATVGGLLLGPVGLAIGGAIGGITAAMWTSNKFRSVSDVILNDMSPIQQAQLLASITTVLNDLRIEDAIALAPLLLMQEPNAQKAILGAVISYVTKDMKLQIAE